MKQRYGRRVGTGLIAAAGAAALALLPSAPAMAGGALYVGGERGPSAATAIEAAIWDAEQSAEGDGRLDCELIGEPRVGPIAGADNDWFRFRASVEHDLRIGTTPTPHVRRTAGHGAVGVVPRAQFGSTHPASRFAAVSRSSRIITC